MATDFTIEGPDALDDELLEAVLSVFVEATTGANVYWYLRQWQLGQKPPCCAKCAGLRYLPEKPKVGQWKAAMAPVALQRGHASCETIAAMHTGNKRATEIKMLTDGGMPLAEAWLVAKKKFQFAFEPTNMTRYFHVVSIDDGVRVDGTQGMRS